MAAALGNLNRNGAKNERVWRDAIRKKVNELVDSDDPRNPQKIRRLDKVVGRLVKAAEKGDMAAINEIGNRLDGRATQEISGTVDVGNSLLQFLQYMQSQDAKVIDGEAIEAEPLAVEDQAETGS